MTGRELPRFVLDERVRDRIVAETRGNPLALLELPRGLTATQLAGGFGLLGAQALSGRIEESFQRRLEALADQTRMLLLICASTLSSPVDMAAPSPLRMADCRSASVLNRSVPPLAPRTWSPVAV